MSTISGVSSVDTAAISTYQTTAAKSTEKADTAAVETEAAVFEKSEEVDSAKKTYTPNTNLIAQLKADAEERTAQLRSIVEQLISGQGKAVASTDSNLWEIFANGDYSNVSEAAKAQAQKDIEEGGYYSVDETSKRILDFAKALTGGDPDKIDTMMDAFKKGYEEATKAWGKDLPDICSNTYDAVIKGFEDWKNESSES